LQHSSPRIFPRIVIKQATLEPHSRLAHLNPIGIGTPFVESLTSYLSRLAEIHSWKFKTLFEFELLPHLNMPYLLSHLGSQYITTTFSFRRVKSTLASVNGTSGAANKVVATLEHLTKRDNLKFLTLLPWAEVLTPLNLLKKHRSWCPDCFTMWRVNKHTIYEPLLWVINEIKVCIVHQRYLISTCPHCNKQYWLLSSNARVGYCAICEEWLGKCGSAYSTDEKPSELELHFQLWVVENVGRILATGPTLQSQLSKKNLEESISSIINGCYEGISQRLAAAISKSKSSVWGWKSGVNKPTLREMLIVCYLTGTSLHDFLTCEGSIESGLFTPQAHNTIKRSKNIKTPPREMTNLEDVRVKLQRYLEPEIEPISMTRVAELIGYGIKALRREFPELCKQISQRYVSNKSKVSQKKLLGFIEEITSAVFYLHSSGQPITRNRIAAYLNKPKYKSNPLVRGPMQEAKLKLGIL
jgi:hypothetical protein